MDNTPFFPVSAPSPRAWGPLCGLQQVSPYNAACAVAYGAYTVAQPWLPLPRAERLEGYLREKTVNAAVQGIIGVAFK